MTESVNQLRVTQILLILSNEFGAERQAYSLGTQLMAGIRLGQTKVCMSLPICYLINMARTNQIKTNAQYSMPVSRHSSKHGRVFTMCVIFRTVYATCAWVRAPSK